MYQAEYLNTKDYLTNDEIKSLNFVSLDGYFDGDEYHEYGDLSDPEKCAEFRKTDIGQAQVALMEKELGVEGGLTDLQIRFFSAGPTPAENWFYGANY